MSLTTYKLIHLFGIFLLVASLGGAAIHAANGGTRRDSLTRRLMGAAHGMALLLIVVAGFGMLAKLNLTGGPFSHGWVIGKILIWLILGGLMMLPYRRPQYARAVFILVPVLGLVAAWLALVKPF